MVPEYAVTLNAPARGNALSAAVVETLHASLPSPRTSAKAAVFVLQAEGRNFSTGFDFSGRREQSHGDLLLRFVRILQAIQQIERLDCVTVARVQGRAYGSGADLAMACDYRVGTTGTRIRFPGFQFGVVLGTRRLTQIVGPHMARELVLEGAELVGTEALEVGLLTHLVDEDDLATWTPPVDSSISMDPLLRQAGTPSDEVAEMAALVTSVSGTSFVDRLEQYLSRLGL